MTSAKWDASIPKPKQFMSANMQRERLLMTLLLFLRRLGLSVPQHFSMRTPLAFHDLPYWLILVELDRRKTVLNTGLVVT